MSRMALALFVASLGLAQAADPRTAHDVVEQRCGPCHQWTRSREALESLRPVLAIKLGQHSPHLLDRLSPVERSILQAYSGASPLGESASAPAPAPVTSPVVAPAPAPALGTDLVRPGRPARPRNVGEDFSRGVGPFLSEELGGDDPLPPDLAPPCEACEDPGAFTRERVEALKTVSLHCGRCHGWATYEHTVLRERERVVVRIRKDHGVNLLSRERRAFLVRALSR